MQKPIFWHQGLFLQPQHFQLNDQYIQSLFDPVHKLLTPYFWGVDHLSIEKAALTNFAFKMLEGRFLFPDNSYIDYPNNAVIEPRSFKGAWGDTKNAFLVYLGIRKFREGGENVSVVPDLGQLKDVNTRFVTTTESNAMNDLYQKGPVAQIRQLYYVIKVFWETEKDQLGEYDLIPISLLDRRADDVVLSEKYIPPSLNLLSSDTLMVIVKEMRDLITARGRQLEAYKRDRGIHTAEFGSRDMIFLLALRTLNRYISLLFHLTESQKAHPFYIYGILRQLIGELSSFSENISVLGDHIDGDAYLSSYDHEDLWGCFSGAHKLITLLIEEITAGPEYILELNYDGTYYAAELPPQIFEEKMRYYLVFETEVEPQSTVQAIETIAKISSREALPLLIARALKGVKVDHLQTPPQELPRRARAIYFQIDHHNDHWSNIQKAKNLALYWDSAPEDLKVELMVVGR